MAVGFFAATIVVLVTVPIVKIASIVRGWSDEHVYVQPHDGRYDDVLKALQEAAARAGEGTSIEDVPKHMVLATSIMRTMAKGAVAPFVADTLRRVVAKDIQMYLYPGDLLLRGRDAKLAHIRAMFGRTSLDADAYMVESAEAKHVQDELTKLHDSFDHHAPGVTAPIESQLRDVYREMMKLDIPYEQWALLELMARRFERRLLVAGVITQEAMPLDQVRDALPAQDANARLAQPAGSVVQRGASPAS